MVALDVENVWLLVCAIALGGSKVIAEEFRLPVEKIAVDSEKNPLGLSWNQNIRTDMNNMRRLTMKVTFPSRR